MTAPRAALLVVAAVLAAPAAAQAGTVTHANGSTTFQSASAGGENVVVGTEGADGFVSSDLNMTHTGCTTDTATRVVCPFASTFIVRMLGGNDDVDATGITDSAALQAFGGAGSDEIDGGPNGDTINGEDGDDALWGYAGNDVLDGGGANDYLRDGPGNDTLTGGPGDDTMVAGPGADSSPAVTAPTARTTATAARA